MPNLDLLAAYERLERAAAAPLNAVIDGRRRARPRRGTGRCTACRSPSRTTSTCAGVVTTNASTVGVPPPAARRRRGRGAAARRRRRPVLQDEPARVRRGQRQPDLRHDLQPARPEPHVGRVEQRLGGAGRRRRLRPRAGHRHGRLDPDPGRLLRHRRPEADVRARAGRRACSRSRRRCDHVGHADAHGRAGAPSCSRVLAGRPCPIEPVAGAAGRRAARASSTTRTCARTCASGSRRRVDALAGLGFELVDVDVAELDLADEALGAIVLYEAWRRAPRRCSSARRDGYGDGHARAARARREDRRRRLPRGARRPMTRVAAGFDRALDEVDVLAGPTVAYPAPPEDPPVRHARGRRRGAVHRPLQPGRPAGGVACRAASVEDGLPAGLQLAAAARARTPAAVGGGGLRGGDRMRMHDCNWMQVEEYLRSRRPDRAAARLDRAARLPVARRRRDPVRAGLGRGGRAARRAGAPGAAVRPDAVLRRVPGQPEPARGDVRRGGPRPARLAARPGLPAVPARQRPRRQLAGGGARAGVDGRRTPTPRSLWHNWWNGPRTWAVVQSIDPDASHASWLENFPWTRLRRRRAAAERKPMADARALRDVDPAGVRELLGDGSYGGPYERPDEDVLGSGRRASRRCASSW